MRIHEKSRVLVELPMLLFLRVADADGGMTAREMERFDNLLAKRDWCRSTLLKASLAHTAEAKAALWRDYAAGEFRATVERAAADLDTVLAGAPAEEREALSDDLSRFCSEIRKASGLLFGDAGARAEAGRLIDLIRRPSSRAPRLEKAEPPGAAARPTLALPEALSGEGVWSGGKLLLRCLHVADESHDVRTFRFAADPPKLLRYRPGQFLTFEIPMAGKTLRRSYSISSSPSRPYTVEVTVKRVEGGVVSNWLHDHLKPGAALYADGPFGKFVCPRERASPLLMLSGGSGVTPLMAMTRWLADSAPDADVVFLHFARTPGDYLFASELRWLQSRMPALRPVFVSSRPDESVTGPSGHVGAGLLREIVPDLASRHVLLCGPTGFMSAASEALKALDFDMTRFEQESFGGAPRPVPPVAAAGGGANVRFSASGKHATASPDDLLLDVALSQDIEVAYSCRAGQCGSCKAPLTQGKVEQGCTDGLKADDVEAGMILLCQARALGDVTLDI